MKASEAFELVKEKVKDLHAAMQEGDNTKVKEYLTFMARFHKYSFYNQILIQCQHPGATLVRGFRQWNQLNRYVVKGSKAIRILAPMFTKEKKDGKETQKLTGFRTVSVFDISQTDGEPVPDFELHQCEGSCAIPFEQMWQVGLAMGAKLRFEPLKEGHKGYNCRDEVVLSKYLSSDEEKTAVLLHELAHYVLHSNRDRLTDDDKKKLALLTTREIEFEAECSAFVLCSLFGIDTVKRSAEYLLLYRVDVEKLDWLLSRVARVVQKITHAIEEHQAALELA